MARFIIVYAPRNRTPNKEAVSKEIVRRIANALSGRAHTVSVTRYHRHLRLPGPVGTDGAIIFNLVYGYSGGAGIVESQAETAERLEATGSVLVGSSASAQRIAQDKLSCGELLARSGILVPVIVEDEYMASGTYIVKPRFGACHRGIRIIHPDTKVEVRLDEIVQHFIRGREFTVGVLEIDGRPKALPPLEIVFRNGDETNEFMGGTRAIDLVIRNDNYCGVGEIAEEAFSILQFRDYGRFDFRLGKDGAVLIDANALPNLDLDRSFLPLIAQETGLGYDGLIQTIAASAIQRARYRSASSSRGSSKR